MSPTQFFQIVMSLTGPVNLSKTMEELKWENLKREFSWPRFFQTLLLVCAFSFFDTVTDFWYASSVDEDVCPLSNNLTSPCGGLEYFQVQNLTYIFISLPTIMLMTTSLDMKCASFMDYAVWPRCCNRGFLRAVAGVTFSLFYMLLNLFSVISVIFDYVSAIDYVSVITFGLAIVYTIPILGIKFLALFAHGPEMKKLMVRTTSYECQFKSALQLWLLAWILQGSGQYKGPIWLSSALSSILLIGKSGAEGSLTFREQIDFEKVPFKRKLGLLLWFAPVHILSALFRIISLALITDRYLVFPWLALALGLPVIVLVTLKLARLESLEDLTTGYILLSVFGELTSITLWGGKTREAGRNFCLAMAAFILLLNSVFLSIIISDPAEGVVYQQANTLNLAQFWKTEAIFCLCCGWLTFPLVVMQMWKTGTMSVTTETALSMDQTLKTNRPQKEFIVRFSK